MRLRPEVVARLADPQGGVVLTSQLVGAGADHDWIARQVAGRRWQRLHRGVLLTHTGPPAWRERAWAALLYAGPDAALSHESAAALQGIRPGVAARLPVHVVIPERRRVSRAAGIVVHRRVTPPSSSGRPRRTVVAETVVDVVANARSLDDAVGWLCDAARAGVQGQAVLDVLSRRPNVRRGALLREVLEEVARGVESPLERRYHLDVERAHGLPQARLQRQETVAGVRIRADAVYEGFRLRVELDGALAHPAGRTDDDTWRDNAVLLARGDVTLRYRWRHVALTPCATAAQVAGALRARGWSGTARRCHPGCAV